MATARRQTHCIALTAQRDNHGNFKSFKIVCGSIDGDGRRRPKPFYLGNDRPRAEKLAIRIRDQWKSIAASAYNVAPIWTDADLAEIQLWLHDREAPLSADERDAMLVHTVIDKYVADVQDRADKGLVCGRRFVGVEWMCRLIRKILPNIPMRLIDEQWLVKLSRTLKENYISKTTGRELSAETVVNRLTMAKQFLCWVDKHNFWQAPRLFYADKSLWNLNRHERNKFIPKPDEAIVLTMEQVAALYQAVKSPTPRLGLGCYAMFLCAMNLGFSHAEFATLKTDELSVDAHGDTWIKRNRRKTGVYAKWKLWPETVAAIEATRAPDNQWGLVFLNAWNSPISPSSQRYAPTTEKWWRRLRKKHGESPNFPNMGYKYLRKTSADMIRKLSDFNTAEAFLSHAEDKISRAYTNKDWDKLTIATEKLREQLFAVLEPKPQLRLAV